VPVKQCQELAAEGKIVQLPPIAFECVLDNTLRPGLDPTGVDWLVPDWTSIRTSSRSSLPDKRYATVMCDVVRTTPAQPDPDFDLCPRRALGKVVHKIRETSNRDFLIGFEVEFEIMKDSGGGGFIPHSAGMGRFAIAGQRDPCFKYVEECIQELQVAGVSILTFQTEGRRGQYEISLGPLPPLQAVDQLVMVHDCIKSVVARHGHVATMCPKPVQGRRQAAGQHTHISIHPPDREDSFLAGMLKRLRSLCAFGLPYDLSYERVQPYLGGEIVAWGTQNREVAIRKIGPGHWEVRCIDATANMYLTLAALLSAGIHGLECQETLTWPDTAIPKQCLSNIEEPCYLPRKLEVALDLLEAEISRVECMMGSRIVRHYLAHKRFELSRTKEMGGDKTRNLLIELF
jgi:glutamine synthetase